MYGLLHWRVMSRSAISCSRSLGLVESLIFYEDDIFDVR